jgi:hypothetical protein
VMTLSRRALAGSDGVDAAVEFLFEDVAIEEEDGIEVLVLGLGGDLAEVF